jgi:hypothetical protein
MLGRKRAQFRGHRSIIVGVGWLRRIPRVETLRILVEGPERAQRRLASRVKYRTYAVPARAHSGTLTQAGLLSFAQRGCPMRSLAYVQHAVGIDPQGG